MIVHSFVQNSKLIVNNVYVKKFIARIITEGNACVDASLLQKFTLSRFQISFQSLVTKALVMTN